LFIILSAYSIEVKACRIFSQKRAQSCLLHSFYSAGLCFGADRIDTGKDTVYDRKRIAPLKFAGDFYIQND